MMYKYILYVYILISAIAISYLTYKNYTTRKSLEVSLSSSALELAKTNLKLGRAQLNIIDSNRYIKYLEKSVEAEISRKNLVLKKYGELRLSLEFSSGSKKAVKKIIKYKKSITCVNSLKLIEGFLYQATTSSDLALIEVLTSSYKDSLISIDTKIKSYKNSKKDVLISNDYKLKLFFKGELVEAESSRGDPVTYFNLWRTNKDGKKQEKLELQSFIITKIGKNKRLFFNKLLRIDGGFFIAVSSLTQYHTGASIGVSLMGYGSTINNLDFRILRVSVDLLDTSIAIGFTPVLYNLAKNLPLVTNMWIGPHISYGKKISAGLVLNGVF